MEFNKAMAVAGEHLVFDPMYLNPKEPTGLWICGNPLDVQTIQLNAVCLAASSTWDDIPKCRGFLDCFPYVVIVEPNAIAREDMVKRLRPKLPALSLYVVNDAGFRGCYSMVEFANQYGMSQLPSILDGADELPDYGLVRVADVADVDYLSIPRTLSGFKRFDSGTLGFLSGRLSVWTGKRGAGKSTFISQMLLESVGQGHTVCAYSGELPAVQFKSWLYVQAAGPQHIKYALDQKTGKKIAKPDALVAPLISQWLGDKFLLFDLEHNTHHDIDQILNQFEYAIRRYGASVFLVDNIMSMDVDPKERDYYRAQSDIVQRLSLFCKRRNVHVHLVVHPKKNPKSDNELDSDDVGGSVNITNRADNVFYLGRTKREIRGKMEDITLLKILKNRDFGAKGEVYLDFDKRARRFIHWGDDTVKVYPWAPVSQQVALEVPSTEHFDEGQETDLPEGW